MRQNELEYWAEGGLPPEVEMANKGGWIDGVFNDTGIVEYDKGPYTIAILTKYGPEEVAYGQPVLHGNIPPRLGSPERTRRKPPGRLN